jgi:hypothetical protein
MAMLSATHQTAKTNSSVSIGISMVAVVAGRDLLRLRSVAMSIANLLIADPCACRGAISCYMLLAGVPDHVSDAGCGDDDCECHCNK